MKKINNQDVSPSYSAELFIKQLSIGHKWAKHVAERLNDQGVMCEVTEMEIRRDLSDRAKFADEKDIVFNNMPGYLDVKSNTLKFSDDPHSFPYYKAFVDTKYGWDRKAEKPLAIVLVSQFTGDMLVIPTSTEKTWEPVDKYDRVRQINDTFLQIKKTNLRRFSDLVEWLIRRQERLQNSPL